MERSKFIELAILMAENYKFSSGKKIEIYKKDELYYAASNGRDFGLVKEITEGTLRQMEKLPDHFYALVIENISERLLKVRVKITKRGE